MGFQRKIIENLKERKTDNAKNFKRSTAQLLLLYPLCVRSFSYLKLVGKKKISVSTLFLRFIVNFRKFQKGIKKNIFSLG